MKVKDLISTGIFKVVNEGDSTDTEITKPFCCDLLSIAMSKCSEGCVWVTVMGNINTLAVATLTEAAVIVLAENTSLDEPALNKAKMQGITVMATELPIFEAALKVHNLLN